MKTFAEKCTEDILSYIGKYKVVPAILKASVEDFVSRSRYASGDYEHQLTFLFSSKTNILATRKANITNDSDESMDSVILQEIRDVIDKSEYMMIETNFYKTDIKKENRNKSLFYLELKRG